jgi:hypothetical protein
MAGLRAADADLKAELSGLFAREVGSHDLTVAYVAISSHHE